MNTPALLLLAASAALCAPLTQGERDRALSELHATRKQFLDAVAGLTPAQWNFKPSPSGWSIAEIAEHLAVKEEGMMQSAEKILASPARPGNVAEVKDKDEMVLRALADRSRKAEAPPELTPTHRWAPPAQIVEHFRAARDRNIAYIRTTADDLRSHFVEHRAAGWIDAYQWFLVDAAHNARHVVQIDEVKASPGYPRR